MSYYRTADHRRLRAELIQRWKPWEAIIGTTNGGGQG